MTSIESLLAIEPTGPLSQADAALFIRLRAALRELQTALESTRAEARSDFQRRLDTADAAIIQVIDDVLQGGKATDVPLDVSAEWARVCRAIRINIVLRERAEQKTRTLAAERELDRAEIVRLDVEVGRHKAERDEARGLAFEALGAIEDWPDCDAKAQHTNTITALDELFTRLCTPSDEVVQPFRDALTRKAERE